MLLNIPVRAPKAPAGLDYTLAALADPTRRAILETLATGETRVTDLAAPFAISLAAVSKHVQCLERAALVTRRRSGREHWLSLNPAPVDDATRWLSAQHELWSSRLQKLDKLLLDEAQSTHSTPIPDER